MRSKTLLIGTGIIAALCVGASLWLPIFGPHLPYINSDPRELAAYLAKNNRDPHECWDLVIWDIGPHPQTGSLQAQCIYKYAELTKDPSACELIMPSDYGLGCVGAAEDHELPCNTDVAPYSVFWMDRDGEKLVTLDACSKNDPARSALGTQCCEVAKVAFKTNENDCSSVASNDTVHDRCLYVLAWKQKDESICTAIQNENARTACIVRTKAYREDPTICDWCKAPILGTDQVGAK